ncbi:beta-lactamase family protein [Mucilaginibacter sp. BJC16-A38]|uniref:serine hydrolase domain-containing protein n=1 Tax=Mucilaginibacter phenanthrenivorans TaxID=1234842 RepID=UPI0021586149|nr:serine hydrolase domain-containing protein [Mucilaginibacter phenanthrenivorans]MCR8556551.1 beta-lactamase family protein [Mucilaginibacter phenanthrenivorans]
MKKLIYLLACCFGLTAASAQMIASVQHLDGNSVTASALSARIAHIADSAKVAGLQVAIIHNGQIAYTKSFGYKDTEKQLLLDDSTEMYAASLTKVVSAYLFLRLVDQGIFSLDEPVHHYLKLSIGQYPKWQDLAGDTAAFNRITPRMLLTHSSGMPVLRGMYGNKVSLISRPGEKFYYSNEGMNLLGFMIEEYTGKRLEDLARKEVFAPLQMSHTSMIWESAFEKNFSFAYFKDGKKYGSERRENGRAAGSMTTTAADYAKFVINLMAHKGLSKRLYRQMLSPQFMVRSKRGFGPLRDSITTDNDRIKLAWGLGTGLCHTPYGPAFFHAGHGDANQNYFIAFPKKGIAVVILSNSENFEGASQAILESCIGDHYSPLAWLGYLGN